MAIMCQFIPLLSLLCTFLSNATPSIELETETVEQKLHRSILKNYDRAVRPIRNASKAIEVSVGLTLATIIDLDEKNQVLSLQVWIEQEWKDEFVKWNPGDFGNITSIVVPSQLIWLPDITLYNMVGDFNNDYKSSFLAALYSSGSVLWAPPVTLHSSCKVDLAYFPFDSQHCHLKFGSWSYHGAFVRMDIQNHDFLSGFQVDLTNRSNQVTVQSSFIASSKYELINTTIKRRVVYYSCCPEPYPDVTAYIHLKRKPSYYINTVLIPCMMLSALSLLVFLSPPESGEKITIGLTVLLAFSILTIMMKDKIPESSDTFPLIGSYMTMVMIMICASISIAVLIVNIHHRGSHQKMPKCLRTIVFSCLRFVVCVGLPASENTALATTLPPQNDHAEQNLISERSIMASEWHLLARVIDRLMFVIFLLATFLITIALFRGQPETTEWEFLGY